MVKEAVALFEADTNRQPYTAKLDSFVVSPLNARQQLAKFLEGARKELLIYDPCVSDPQMVRILEQQSRAGVEVRIVGCVKRDSQILRGCVLSSLRLHTRTILRDSEDVFLGSQSLRAAELDARREVGVVLSSKAIARQLKQIFENDWKDAKQTGDYPSRDESQSLKMARKVAKVITKELPPVAEVISAIAGDSGLKKANLTKVDMNALEDTVREAVKNIVVETLQDATDKTAA
jgi:phosphatidylserine/phosphatidylglycerophosphate/cardiolipin synthase-like enzyme